MNGMDRNDGIRRAIESFREEYIPLLMTAIRNDPASIYGNQFNSPPPPPQVPPREPEASTQIVAPEPDVPSGAAVPEPEVSAEASVPKAEEESAETEFQKPEVPPKKKIKQYRPASVRVLADAPAAFSSLDEEPNVSYHSRRERAAATATTPTASTSKAGRRAGSSKRKRAAPEAEIEEPESDELAQEPGAATESGEARYNFRKRRN